MAGIEDCCITFLTPHPPRIWMSHKEASLPWNGMEREPDSREGDEEARGSRSNLKSLFQVSSYTLCLSRGLEESHVTRACQDSGTQSKT